jgi:hypothetical protein
LLLHTFLNKTSPIIVSPRKAAWDHLSACWYFPVGVIPSRKLAIRVNCIFPWSGKPNPSTFPFESVTVELKEGRGSLNLAGQELDDALQYMPTAGIPRLVEVCFALFLSYRT